MAHGSRIWIALLLVTSLLAGCVGDSGPAGNETNLSPTNATNGSTGEASSSDTNGTEGNQSEATNDSIPRGASLTANTTQGQAPLPVGFIANASGENATWVLSFGDGNATNGTQEQLPANLSHTYEASGNFSAELNVTYPDGASITDQANLTIEAGDAAGNATDSGPTYEPRHKEWIDAAAFGVPYLGPERATLVKTALDNGLNGTFVLGYDVNVTVKTSSLEVTATADAVEDAVPDYDMVLYGPDGSSVGNSGEGGTNEAVSVSNPDPGVYTIGLLFWGGADAPPAPQFPVTITADAV